MISIHLQKYLMKLDSFSSSEKIGYWGDVLDASAPCFSSRYVKPWSHLTK